MPLSRLMGQKAQLLKHGVFHPFGGKGLARTALSAELLPGGADVIMVLLAAHVAVGRRHGMATKTAEEQPLEKSIGTVPVVGLTSAMLAEQVLDLVPNI